MKDTLYLIVGLGGVRGIRKTRPNLNWDEVAIRLNVGVPDDLFKRPHLEATISVDPEQVQSTQIVPDLIINTKELIEQQTGAKIEFRVLPIERDEDHGPTALEATRNATGEVPPGGDGSSPSHVPMDTPEPVGRLKPFREESTDDATTLDEALKRDSAASPAMGEAAA